MDKKIYYFTGTGNSLSIAKKIHDEIDDSDLYSIPNNSVPDQFNDNTRIVIVSPVYLYNIPYIVRDFIKKIKGGKHV